MDEGVIRKGSFCKKYNRGREGLAGWGGLVRGYDGVFSVPGCRKPAVGPRPHTIYVLAGLLRLRTTKPSPAQTRRCSSSILLSDSPPLFHRLIDPRMQLVWLRSRNP